MDNSQLSVAPGSPRLRTSHWKSAKELDGLTRSAISLSLEEAARRKEFLWNAMLTEYDASNFALYLSDREFSPDFKRFERAWRRDEWNHYLGFRRIVALLYDQNEAKIASEVTMDRGNFEPIGDFLKDEFKICLLLAYDEIATFKSYLAEFPFYRSFGDPRVIRWFQKVTRDELNHFINCVEIIRHRHPDRVPEAKESLDQFIEWDLRRSVYERTFVLDHYWYSVEYLQHCQDLICDYFRNGLRNAEFFAKIRIDDTKGIDERYEYR